MPAGHDVMNKESSKMSMIELFRMDFENHSSVLTESLLALENDPTANHLLESLMRAAHSIKGAARMVGLDVVVSIAHVMEDCFVAAQEDEILIKADYVDIFLQVVDVLTSISQEPEESLSTWFDENKDETDNLICAMTKIKSGETPDFEPTQAPSSETSPPEPIEPSGSSDKKSSESKAEEPAIETTTVPKVSSSTSNNALRVSSESLNRLMGLAGESIIESKWIRTHSDALMNLKQKQVELIGTIDSLRDYLDEIGMSEVAISLYTSAQKKADRCRQEIGDRLTELEEYDRRVTNLSDRLNNEVISSRMRPFSDATRGFSRMVRDLARSLGKKITLIIEGEHTQVDRDILSKVEAPLNHLLRNAIDHGIEFPQERIKAGKPEQGQIRLTATHRAGMLSIMVSDDGCGVDPEPLRKKIVEKKLAHEEMAKNMSRDELLEFLFLPGFSTKENITDISGRGVGMDVVHTMIQETRGQIRTLSETGKGMTVNLQLPQTLSVIRGLLVEIAGQYYSFPLARTDRILTLNKNDIESIGNKQFFTLDNQHIGLVDAIQVMELEGSPSDKEEMPVVVLGDRYNLYGIVVDRFIGERDLAVQPIDKRLGKIQDIDSTALMEDGSPVLVIDVDDLVRSIDAVISGERLRNIGSDSSDKASDQSKKILVVDDSITVREVERNLLESRGYYVDVAVDGMDAWNTVRTGNYDLVVTDIDMPRMNGIELVKNIKNDSALKQMPIMIVSYKDRQEDRDAGLEAGADYYLTKGSFHDETLVDAVIDMIGEPELCE